jgi:hypothetical protein
LAVRRADGRGTRAATWWRRCSAWQTRSSPTAAVERRRAAVHVVARPDAPSRRGQSCARCEPACAERVPARMETGLQQPDTPGRTTMATDGRRMSKPPAGDVTRPCVAPALQSRRGTARVSIETYTRSEVLTRIGRRFTSRRPHAATRGVADITQTPVAPLNNARSVSRTPSPLGGQGARWYPS